MCIYFAGDENHFDANSDFMKNENVTRKFVQRQLALYSLSAKSSRQCVAWYQSVTIEGNCRCGALYHHGCNHYGSASSLRASWMNHYEWPPEEFAIKKATGEERKETTTLFNTVNNNFYFEIQTNIIINSIIIIIFNNDINICNSFKILFNFSFIP